MANKSKTKCLSCGLIFTAEARNRGRQKYCTKSACRLAAKAARQRRWREQPQNHDYFRGRYMWNESASGEQRIRGTGARTNVASRLRYKTPWGSEIRC
jgi:hypothetical protein